ncbi:MAG: protein translocase subunit SecD [Spirochaetales bacterium]|nr:protein translocase subunit SecD [Spirochaetales bacterium]
MSIRFRFLVILLFIGLAGVLLSPTIKWYFFTPEDRQVLANSSKEQIREYAKKQAAGELEELTALVKNSPDEVLADSYSFLIAEAKNNYKLEKRDFPAEWTVKSTLEGFNSANELFSALEEFHREDITDLKDMKNKILQLGLDISGGLSVTIEADETNLAERLGHEPSAAEIDEAIALAMTTLNSRIDKFGVTEPSIRKQANNQIIIEVPGEVDQETVNSFLHGKGSLNFHIVNDDASNKVQDIIRRSPGEIFENGRPEDDTLLPEDVVVMGVYKKDAYGVDELYSYLAVEKEAGLDGSHIKSALVRRDSITNQPEVIFELDSEGGDLFYELTSNNVGKRLAIVMDNKIKEGAPNISEGIRNSVRMTGFDSDEAQQLSIVLKTAALPINLNVIDEQAVGASLGSDAIRTGIMAMIIGFIAVILFMIIYYKGAGVVATVALLLNFLFIMAILSSFKMTLTMTSIAGLILNVGMAVDANVIIFERIKEELKIGKGRAAAIEAGFKKAFWTVMDANITTLIAAIFLSQLGKGPIQGFAVTLAVGIVSSLFTAIFVSKAIFSFGSDTLKMKKLSIGWGLK